MHRFNYIGSNERVQFLCFRDGKEKGEPFCFLVVHPWCDREILPDRIAGDLRLAPRYAAEVDKTVFLLLAVVAVIHIPHRERERVGKQFRKRSGDVLVAMYIK